MYSEKKISDITIIGGGPTGLFAAFYGGMRNASVTILESLPHLGGQLSALYPEKYIYDVAGFPKVKAQDLVDNLIEQTSYFETDIFLEKVVTDLQVRNNGIIKISTNDEEQFTKSVIITAGNGAFKPKKLALSDAERFENSNLHYFVHDMNAYKNKRVLICGGGDSAVDWALMLEPIAKEVTLVHRRDRFRAHEHSVSKLKASNVQIKTPYTPKKLLSNENRIESVILEKVKEEDTQEIIDVDEVLVNYGFSASLGPIKDWGLEIEKNSIVVNSRMETNIPGVYAAGDICTFDGKVKLIATGFGDAPTAINNAIAYINPGSKVQPKHSTAIFA
ncbi:NAD(P)/FAD-dependent oxidoreductase [Aquibacillus sp. 3ASR75-11]|uniref:Ferredoxin--NADP reductase n=1 Tax=Terrihalobacillus insolitus TaxID=2950438 RepID=A0A9X3WSW7_9BACI|nr:NAD(P)/FAD-dependent oxidoreductase [Terrihalobacillus insolitus]MDC3415175.1 NAD(P)/FAD-dependent oxidoreductase [Terrihalobacillus insolitus]MDC3424053.1 NAD(P)/FAD-dependent oxidoreductase [Terrihalobacillus insolitus]